jgi:hypothetical protein
MVQYPRRQRTSKEISIEILLEIPKILGSHGDDNVDCGPPTCGVVWSGTWLLMLRKNVPPIFPERCWDTFFRNVGYHLQGCYKALQHYNTTVGYWQELKLKSEQYTES